MEGKTKEVTGRIVGSKRRIVVGITVCCLTAACQTVQTTRLGVVQVDREQRVLSFISEQDMQKSAAEAYSQQLQKARAEGKLNTDAALLQRVKTVSERLIQQTIAFREDARDWPWEVNVLSSPERNAYAMPGGKIMVYSGMITDLDLNDAEIAAVVGHEISREHSSFQRIADCRASSATAARGAALSGEAL